MKKAVASILLALMISSVMVDARPTVKEGGNVQCIINILPRMTEIASNPVGVFMEFSACAGDQTWDLLAPFLGGFLRVILVKINTVIPGSESKAKADLVASDFSTGFTVLQLYNIVMDMLKQAVGELLGFLDASGFAYKYSNV